MSGLGRKEKKETLFPSLHVAGLLLPTPLVRSLFTNGIRSTNFAPASLCRYCLSDRPRQITTHSFTERTHTAKHFIDFLNWADSAPLEAVE